jgi:lipoate-protein ligase A
VASSDNLLNIPIKKLRIIPFDSFPGKINMAIDYYFSENCQSNDVPILRFYGWLPYCVSIGYHQKDKIIDFKKLKHDGYDFVKRPTGGRAILHAEELTYSVIVPRDLIHHRLLYHFIHQIFADALRTLGYPVELKNDNEKVSGLTHKADDFPCFTKSAQTEVQYKNKKLIGSAQKIFHYTILQHGSLLIGNKHKDLPSYLKIANEIKDSIKNEINDKTTCLNNIRQSRITPEKIIESVINQLELVRGISLNSGMISELAFNSIKEY